MPKLPFSDCVLSPQTCPIWLNLPGVATHQHSSKGSFGCASTLTTTRYQAQESMRPKTPHNSGSVASLGRKRSKPHIVPPKFIFFFVQFASSPPLWAVNPFISLGIVNGDESLRANIETTHLVAARAFVFLDGICGAVGSGLKKKRKKNLIPSSLIKNSIWYV